jgi:hypothetical protein
MANYTSYKPTVYPPDGDTDYPDTVNNLIDAVEEDIAQELEDARAINSPSLLDTLNNYYVQYTLVKNIDGLHDSANPDSGYRLTAMANGSADYDYVTLSQAETILGVTNPDVDDLTASSPLNLASAEYRGSSNGNSISTFDFTTSTLTNNTTYLSPGDYNKTYYLDFSGESITEIKLDGPGMVPKNGDRLRFIFKLPETNDSIQDSTNKIMGLTETITFGKDYDHVIYDLVYTSSIKGWFFTSVELGDEVP